MASGLDKWLATASKTTIAIIVISAGILFIVFANPPRTQCDSQLDMFRESQKGFLFPDPNDKEAKKKANYRQMSDYCKAGNSPGACYEFFARLRTFVRDLDSIPKECSDDAAGIDEIKNVLWQSSQLMIRLAWGEKPPASYFEKFGWLDTSDISLFCGLKRHSINFFGNPAWDSFREKQFSELPGAKDITRKDAWDIMIISENCGRYP